MTEFNYQDFQDLGGVLFDNGMLVKIYDDDCQLYAIGKVVGHSDNGQFFDVEVAKDQDVYVERHNISKLMRHTSFQPSVVVE